MQGVARFEKVSPKRFQEDLQKTFPALSGQWEDIYERLRLPQRATSGSAGYDFFIPMEITLQPGETINIPTGCRVRIREDYVLMLFPRSGLGFKYRLQLNNTVGIIDSDYYGSDNEGHIFVKLTNDSKEEKTVSLNAGDGFIQGVFLPFGLAEDDHVSKLRNGGFGSSGV